MLNFSRPFRVLGIALLLAAGLSAAGCCGCKKPRPVDDERSSAALPVHAHNA